LIRAENPTLIMLDFLLPKKNGWEVYQEIQQDPKLAVIPLMLMSGRKEEVTEKLPEPFEFFAFVEKPFEKNQLVTAIKEAMQKSALKKKTLKVAPVAAPPAPAPAPVAGGGGSSPAELQALNQKVAQMEKEIALLKKQMGQLVQFIKQKLR